MQDLSDDAEILKGWNSGLKWARERAEEQVRALKAENEAHARLRVRSESTPGRSPLPQGVASPRQPVVPSNLPSRVGAARVSSADVATQTATPAAPVLAVRVPAISRPTMTTCDADTQTAAVAVVLATQALAPHAPSPPPTPPQEPASAAARSDRDFFTTPASVPSDSSFASSGSSFASSGASSRPSRIPSCPRASPSPRPAVDGRRPSRIPIPTAVQSGALALTKVLATQAASTVPLRISPSTPASSSRRSVAGEATPQSAAPSSRASSAAPQTTPGSVGASPLLRVRDESTNDEIKVEPARLCAALVAMHRDKEAALERRIQELETTLAAVFPELRV